MYLKILDLYRMTYIPAVRNLSNHIDMYKHTGSILHNLVILISGSMHAEVLPYIVGVYSLVLIFFRAHTRMISQMPLSAMQLATTRVGKPIQHCFRCMTKS